MDSDTPVSVYLVGLDGSIFKGERECWNEYPGGARAKDVARDGSGKCWIITDGNGIAKSDGTSWLPLSGVGFKIAVTKAGIPMHIGRGNYLYMGNGASWTYIAQAGTALDIAFDSQDRLWIIGTDNTISYFERDKRYPYPGSGRGLAISASPEGVPYIIGTDNKVYEGMMTGWRELPGGACGTDISVDASERVWIIGLDKGVWYFDGTGWRRFPGGMKGERIVV